jgi:hypothetical protein
VSVRGSDGDVSLERVTLEIVPQPSEAERAAILLALRRVLVAEAGDGSPGAWWAAGLPHDEAEPAGP